MPEEKSYLAHLQEARVPLNEYDFPSHKLANIQDQFDKLVERNYYLHRAAYDAFKSYLHVLYFFKLSFKYIVNMCFLFSIKESA